MNVGMMVMQDGNPCIVSDEPFAYPVKEVLFDSEDFTISLVYEEGKGTLKFEYPLDHSFVHLLKKVKLVGIACAKGEQVIDMYIVSVIFLEVKKVR